MHLFRDLYISQFLILIEIATTRPRSWDTYPRNIKRSTTKQLNVVLLNPHAVFPSSSLLWSIHWLSCQTQTPIRVHPEKYSPRSLDHTDGADAITLAILSLFLLPHHGVKPDGKATLAMYYVLHGVFAPHPADITTVSPAADHLVRGCPSRPFGLAGAPHVTSR